MATMLMNFDLQDHSATKKDISLNTETFDCKRSLGPGKTILGYYPYSLAFGPSCKLKATLGEKEFINNQSFCIRLLFRVTGPVAFRQNLAEASSLPFALFVEPCNKNAAEFQLTAGVLTEPYGWMEASTFCHGALQKGIWYVADLVFDKDILALFVNGAVAGIKALPMATIPRNQEPARLYLGSTTNGVDYRFEGEMAAFQWYNGIPPFLASQISICRDLPEWHISEKQTSLLKIHDFGSKTKKLLHDPYQGTITQEYEKGVIIFITKNRRTIELYGPLWPHYQTYLSTLVALNIQKNKTLPVTKEPEHKPPTGRGTFFHFPGTTIIHEHHPSLHHMMQLFVRNMQLPA